MDPTTNCGNCHKCLEGKTVDLGNGFSIPVSRTRMIVCSVCGNKRCPHATDHELDCTDSNEAGQPGSIYGGFTPNGD